MPNVETRLAAAGVEVHEGVRLDRALLPEPLEHLLRGPVRAHDRRAHEHAAARRRHELRRQRRRSRPGCRAPGYRTGPLRQVPERLQRAVDAARAAVRAARLGRVARLQGAALLRRGPRRARHRLPDGDRGALPVDAAPNYAGCPADQVGEDPVPVAAELLDRRARGEGPSSSSTSRRASRSSSTSRPTRRTARSARRPATSTASTRSRPATVRRTGTRAPTPRSRRVWSDALCPMGTDKQNNIDADRRKQLASLQAVDRAVGAILDKLAALGEDQNTHHRSSRATTATRGARHCHRPKRCPYDECMRVPMVVRVSAADDPSRVDDRIGLNIDIALHVRRARGRRAAGAAGRPEHGALARRHRVRPGAPTS